MDLKDCPCEKCLVRAVCKTRMCEKDHLIVDYVKKCPLVYTYITEPEPRYKDELCRFYFHKKINKVCDFLGVENQNWVWRANEVGVY